MFYEEIKKITISGKELPVKCDIIVLEKLQDTFGDLIRVQDGLQGFVQVKDKNGDWATSVDENGNMTRTGYITRPNVKMTITALAYMIQEGLDVTGADEKVDIKELMRQEDYTLEELAKICQEEYNRTFESKNSRTTQTSDTGTAHAEN